MITASTLVRAAIAGTLATACLFTAVAPASAATGTSKTVSYADLDLSRPADRAALDRRVKAAAKSVCQIDGSDLNSRMLANACVKTAIATAHRGRA